MFAAKFGKSENAEQDLLLAIHNRMFALRTLSMESLRLSMATRLLHLTDASVIPLSRAEASVGIAPEIGRLMKSAEKLGEWCGVLTLHEIAVTLKLRF